jgi:kynurenine formamidase
LDVIFHLDLQNKTGAVIESSSQNVEAYLLFCDRACWISTHEHIIQRIIRQQASTMAASLTTGSDEFPVRIPNIQYAEASELNTLSVTLLRKPMPNDTARLFLVYIHGGAWRDPAIPASSFAPTEKHLLSNVTPAIQDKISGIASINYRLSPYPAHPTNPSNPHDPARNARHPDHINDVLAAILYLQEKYSFGNRYVLIGHSCGATLALQVAMKRFWGSQYDPTAALELNVEPPLAIIGVSGIYDVAGLVDDNAAQPAYRDLVVNAMGSGVKVWEEASPVNGDYEDGWQDGKLAVLVHSEDDELVAMKQPDTMWRVLGEQGFSEEVGSEKTRKFIKVQGVKHDEIWEDGEALADVILQTVEDLAR